MGKYSNCGGVMGVRPVWSGVWVWTAGQIGCHESFSRNFRQTGISANNIFTY